MMVIGLMQIILAIIDSHRNVSLDFVHRLFCFPSYRRSLYGFWDKIFITGSCEAAATRNTLGAALSCGNQYRAGGGHLIQRPSPSRSQATSQLHSLAARGLNLLFELAK